MCVASPTPSYSWIESVRFRIFTENISICAKERMTYEISISLNMNFLRKKICVATLPLANKGENWQ